MTRKSKKFIWIGIVLIIALSGIFIVISVNMNGNDMTQAEEQESINVDVNKGQDMLSNPEAELPEQENEIGEDDEKVYEDKFIDLNIEYLGSGKSSKEKHVQKTIYEDGKECALTGHYIFRSERGYALEAELWDIHDLDFVLDIDENNYYIVIYGKRICWMQYNPGRMSQFGGVEYRIGVDWETDIEKGTFFFYEIDGEQIERGYLPEEITLEFQCGESIEEIFTLFQGDIYQKFNEMRTYDKYIQFNGKPDKEIIGNISDNPEWKEWLVYYDGIIVECF